MLWQDFGLIESDKIWFVLFQMFNELNRLNVNQIDPNGLAVQREWWFTNLGKGLFHQGFATDFHIERFAEGFSYIFRDVGF